MTPEEYADIYLGGAIDSDEERRRLDQWESVRDAYAAGQRDMQEKAAQLAEGYYPHTDTEEWEYSFEDCGTDSKIAHLRDLIAKHIRKVYSP